MTGYSRKRWSQSGARCGRSGVTEI